MFLRRILIALETLPNKRCSLAVDGGLLQASQPWMHPESQAVRASKSLLRSGGAAAHAAAQAAFDEQSFVGAIFVAANESGGLVVAENLGGPHWL